MKGILGYQQPLHPAGTIIIGYGAQKQRPAVVMSHRGGKLLTAPLTNRDFWAGVENPPFDPAHASVDRGRFLNAGRIWAGELILLAPDEAASRRIGRCLPPLAERLLQVHSDKSLTEEEIKLFRSACSHYARTG